MNRNNLVQYQFFLKLMYQPVKNIIKEEMVAQEIEGSPTLGDILDRLAETWRSYDAAAKAAIC